MIAGLTSYTSYHRFVSIYSHCCGYFVLILSVIQDNHLDQYLFISFLFHLVRSYYRKSRMTREEWLSPVMWYACNDFIYIFFSSFQMFQVIVYQKAPIVRPVVFMGPSLKGCDVRNNSLSLSLLETTLSLSLFYTGSFIVD